MFKLGLIEVLDELGYLHNNDKHKKLKLFQALMLSRLLDHNPLEGFQAVLYHLVEKYHWLPEQIYTLSPDELLFLLKGSLGADPLDLLVSPDTLSETGKTLRERIPQMELDFLGFLLDSAAQ